ncbi:YajQ family cyclic di-GMP-binding protein [Methylophaga sp. OBS3]|uniref:YajQ family cyclic di-GMP-binding protein n=1 Tax=Methylophaga sp. OBS3 TaxID=2991934 RepID=UPI0022513C94|nr:YajQ family cyclic di-GMP-binding protein [Methylophaga sp. OBS3]MCX4190294.1 YajQ family cyclic di-GMP-binding protein [Methylophaga sp. OBS3]
MPSFDIVSEVDKHELTNAVDQANRELTTRFDFRGTDARVEQSEKVLTMYADSDFQLEQLLDILRLKLVKRSIDVKCLEVKDPKGDGKLRKQDVIVREGLDKDVSRIIVKLIKDSKIKVQAAIQGDSVRVTGKKRDELQQIIALLRSDEGIEMPLQFNNFRD